MTEAASPPKAEAEKRSATAALGRVPECRRHVTLSSRSRREIGVNNARTGARVPKVRRSWRPRPLGDAATSVPERVPVCRCHVTPAAETEETSPHQRPDGCPRVDGTSPPPAETEESFEQTRSQTPCPSADLTSPPPAETEEDSATSTPGRVRLPTSRHPLQPKPKKTPQHRRPNGARLPMEHHPLQPKPKKTPQHRRPNGARLPKEHRPLQPKPERTPNNPRPCWCSFVDETSHPSAETEERFATSTPERARLSTRRHPLRPKPEGAPQHRRESGARSPPYVPPTAAEATTNLTHNNSRTGARST